jgi:hypothetical protein
MSMSDRKRFAGGRVYTGLLMGGINLLPERVKSEGFLILQRTKIVATVASRTRLTIVFSRGQVVRYRSDGKSVIEFLL